MSPARYWSLAIRRFSSAAAVLLAVAAAQLREKKQLVDLTARQIEDQIAALDPGTRAAVITRLTADAARVARGRNTS